MQHGHQSYRLEIIVMIDDYAGLQSGGNDSALRGENSMRQNVAVLNNSI